MRKQKVRFVAMFLIMVTVMVSIPMSVYATDTMERYNYAIFADKDIIFGGNVVNVNGNIHANRSIVYQCINGVINGTSSSAVANYGSNSNVNTRHELVGQDVQVMKGMESAISERYFGEDVRVSSLSRMDQNYNLNQNIYSENRVSLGGNVNIGQAALGAAYDVEIGVVKVSQCHNINANKAVLYSAKGDIVIDVDNFNFNGLIYAPNGTVTITSRGNIGIQGIIIAQSVELQGGNINIQSDGVTQQLVADLIEENKTEVEDNETQKSEDSSEQSTEKEPDDSTEEIEIPKEDYNDTDGDGLIDFIEKEIGTDINEKDTDRDGLSDFDEIYLIGTNPTKKDSDGNGVSDDKEDLDSDGLNSLEEIEIGTLPLLADSDTDGLTDGEEQAYGTDPLNIDTDSDSLWDADELSIGLDPRNPKTFGIPDAEYTMLQSIDSSNEILSNINVADNAYELHIDAKVSGNIANNLDAGITKYADILENESMVGLPVEISYNDKCKVEEVTLSFEMKDNYVQNEVNYFSDATDSANYSEELVGIKRLQVFKYFEDTKVLLPVETTHDVINNTVKATTDEFGVYCLMDLEKWILDLSQYSYMFEEQPALMSLEPDAMEYNYSMDMAGCSDGDVVIIDPEDIQNVEEIHQEEVEEPGMEMIAQECEDNLKEEEKETEIMSETQVSLTRKPLLRGKDNDASAIDIVFVLQTTGTSENIFDYQREMICSIADTVFQTYDDARIYIVTYRYDSAEILQSNSLVYFTDVETLQKEMYLLEYLRTTSYCDRGMGFLCVRDDLPLREGIPRYVYSMINGNTNVHISGYEQLALMADMDIIYSEVQITSHYYYSNVYEEILIHAIEENNGIYIVADENAEQAILNHLSSHAEFKDNRFYAITANGWCPITLNAPLRSGSLTDTDGDSLTDWNEVDYLNELIVHNEDGSITLPTINECMNHTELTYVERGLDRITGGEGFPSDIAGQMAAQIRYTYRVMPLNSDPTSVDSDRDGYGDAIDHSPLRTDRIPVKFQEYIVKGYIDATDLRNDGNGLTICVKSLGDIMDELGITADNYDDKEDYEYGSNQYYFSVWYLYAIETEDYEYNYSLLKLRTYTDGQIIGKGPSVSVPFREFNMDLLDGSYDISILGEELADITGMGTGVQVDESIRGYFADAENVGNYFIADIYIELVIEKDLIEGTNSFYVPSDIHDRVREKINQKEQMYDEEALTITVNDVNNLTLYERQCILATRAGTINYNAFAGEIVAHAYAEPALSIIGILPDNENLISILNIYNSTKRADLSSEPGANESIDEFVEQFFAYEDSDFVEEQRDIHGYR